ncbi:CynX/NimT family MFS transporter [Bacillus sp. FJAT-28004]|uniref:MFS transporter n=1 Tax=Bacillus sp. FJAT-28004 TaxID=1679165 RepID=UPI0006B5F5AA|nr:MFS transporter [Bacillus sp. FJAT-28004]
MKKYSLLIVALFIASLNLRPAINSIAPLLENIRDNLGMNASVASLLTSIPVLCMGLFSPAAVKFSGKWGIERVLGWSLFVIGIGTVLRFFTHSTFSLLITAFIAGVGIAVAGPLLPGFIKRHFPKHVPSMIAVYTVALTLGAALSSGFARSLQDGFNSWQSALGIWAVIAFGAVLLWWMFVLRRTPTQVQLSSTGSKASLPWKNKKAWQLTLSFGLMAMLFYSFTAWLPQIVQGMGYSKSYAANVLTIFVVVQIPVSLILPILLRHFPSRRLWLSVEALLELIGLILLASSAEPWIAAIFIGAGAGGLFSLNLLLPLDATNNPQEAASWSAMTQSIGYVLGATGPIILGWIHDATESFSTAIAGLIVINVVMIFVQFAATSIKKSQRAA